MAQLDIRVNFDVKRFRRQMLHAQEEIPRAMADSLNWTAYDAQKALQSSLPSHFTVRSRYTTSSLSKNKIEKARANKLYSVVGSTADYLAIHGVGGPRPQDKESGVPSKKHIRSPITTKTTVSKWPNRLRKKTKRRKKRGTFPKAKPFYMRSGGKVFLAKRDLTGPGTSRRTSSGKRRNLQILYVLEARPQIKKTWPFESIVRDLVAKKWPGITERAIKKALRRAARGR